MMKLPAKFLMCCGLVFTASSAWAFENLIDTVHNLSASGPGPIKSQTEADMCVFCHTPHNRASKSPQWNRRSGDRYTPYESSTAQAIAADVGSSRLCLSCHDGTIALGDMMSNERARARGRGRANQLETVHLAGRANLGRDLRDDHPVSIVYDPELAVADQQLADPKEVDLPLLDNELQCISCHNAHSNRIPPFLQRTTRNGELCVTCHALKGADWDWESSSHAVSAAGPRNERPWEDRKPEWRGATVAENSCMNCHTPHNAVTRERLVKDQEEETCYRCHDGTTAVHDIQAEIRKIYRHPVDETPSSGHEGMIWEDPLSMAKHVECEDCHNTHAARDDLPMISFNPASPFSGEHSIAPRVNATLMGVTGIDISGNTVPEAEHEYEVCFKCHGVPGRNACDNRRCPTPALYDMERQDGTYNLREKLDPGNPALISYHPVTRNDPNNDHGTPTLRVDTPLDRVNSLIYCGDCHAGDRSPAAGSGGPGGAHGSVHEGLLAQRYEFDPVTPAASSPVGLCFKCHDAGILFSDRSFPHRKHVVEEDASCVNCHDPHGSAVYPHLINFLLKADVGGQTWEISGAGGFFTPTWQDDGEFAGTCWLSCHGTVHDGVSYTEDSF